MRMTMWRVEPAIHDDVTSQPTFNKTKLDREYNRSPVKLDLLVCIYFVRLASEVDCGS